MRSTLSLLIFICTAFCLARASLVESTDGNGDTSILERSWLQQLFFQIHEHLYKTEALLREEQHKEVIKSTEKTEKDKLPMWFCLLITTLEQYKGQRGDLIGRGTFPTFLVYGDMAVARGAIVEFAKGSNYHVKEKSIQDAIILSFKDKQYGRAIDLMKAIDMRHAGSTRWVGRFMNGLFRRLVPEKNSVSLKRFLTLSGEKFKEKHPILFKVFCQTLVSRLRTRSYRNPNAKKLLLDLVGQPSLLTPEAFVGGFLFAHMKGTYTLNFIAFNWAEAIEEGLKEIYPGSIDLWSAVMAKFPNKYPTKYPPEAEVLAAVLKNFKTKEDLQEAWTKANVPNIWLKLEELAIQLRIPKVMMMLVTEYSYPACTWHD